MAVVLAPSTKRRSAFSSLTVREVRRLTEDAVEVTLDVPEELQDRYDYLPGQYVALRATLDVDGEPKEVRRSYSICADPRPGELRVAVKRDLGGIFSTWVNESLKAGDTLEVMSPLGQFTPRTTPGQAAVSLVAVAAGSGITPVLSIARSMLAAGPHVRFDLIYANRAAMDVMFLEELADLKDRYPSRFALHHVLSREQRISPLLTGRIDAEKLERLLGTVLAAERVDEWFLCGPFELVQLCRDSLAERGVPADRVRFELFTTGEPTRPEGSIGRPVAPADAGQNYSISFNLDGLKGSVQSPTHARESILNAALRVRPDVPFACAGGVCGTCRAKVVEGTVEMEENYALEPDEVANGFVLTCQAHPTSDSVSVDYDA
ncbi:phenylacetate-CoA oxygenase/reductase subunit PaaK [Arthrobacter agilis]|jgi:ring-1,2-phenylacetyl-CoA epoxidase subunit PaaE|uniref:Phenylacetate-CoA oxygenase/reductase subunit PaaK n=1 Tax=Arthrobacter agilis TaxID=37921 RepID=A0A2L0UHW9_9MICC|nr:1,2-phenylacetyl-CoA epoxidase subunit PaaE [Arthrobacter agilis]AUZ88833.1 phenylacetate-CoA oxygenase/reductase subunit PaaK [Arthrobacter agilis]